MGPAFFSLWERHRSGSFKPYRPQPRCSRNPDRSEAESRDLPLLEVRMRKGHQLRWRSVFLLRSFRDDGVPKDFRIGVRCWRSLRCACKDGVSLGRGGSGLKGGFERYFLWWTQDFG